MLPVNAVLHIGSCGYAVACPQPRWLLAGFFADFAELLRNHGLSTSAWNSRAPYKVMENSGLDDSFSGLSSPRVRSCRTDAMSLRPRAPAFHFLPNHSSCDCLQGHAWSRTHADRFFATCASHHPVFSQLICIAFSCRPFISRQNPACLLARNGRSRVFHSGGPLSV